MEDKSLIRAGIASVGVLKGTPEQTPLDRVVRAMIHTPVSHNAVRALAIMLHVSAGRGPASLLNYVHEEDLDYLIGAGLVERPRPDQVFIL